MVAWESLVRVFLVVSMVTCAACASDYVHIVVEGSSPELSSGPVTVELAVFGGGHGIEHPFAAELRTGVSGSAPDQTSTDFNLVLDREVDSVDVRVGIATPNGRWSASALLEPPMDGATQRLVLQPGDRALGSTRLGVGAPGAVTRYGAGLATAWASTEGVSLRIDSNPGQPLARPEVISTDRSAQQVRVVSPRTVPPSPGPDRMVVAWIGGDRMGHLLYYDAGGRGDIVDIGPADHLHVVCPADGAAAALLVHTGSSARISLRDAEGAETASVALPGAVRDVAGLVAIGVALVVAARVDDEWQLMRIADGAVGITAVVEEVLAVSRSESDQVLTVENRDGNVAVMAYSAGRLSLDAASNLIPTARLIAQPFGGVDVAGCGVTWPEPRTDGTGSIDLWYRDLDAVGAPSTQARVLPAAWRGSQLGPRLVCTDDGTYAIFATASDLQALDGTLAVRRAPEPQP